MTFVAEGIAIHPTLPRTAATHARDRADALPTARRIAFEGCRTSLYVARAAVEAGHGESEPFPASEMAAGWRYVRQFVFLGRAWTVGLAREAALKVREAALAWSEAYPAMGYRHGPISVAGEGTVVWPLEQRRAEPAGEGRATAARLGTEVGAPIAELVHAQCLAVALADARGLDPDRSRHLSGSVVLDGDAHRE